MLKPLISTIDRIGKEVDENSLESNGELPEWEKVAEQLERIEVDNGILYRTYTHAGSVAMVHVPYRDTLK